MNVHTGPGVLDVAGALYALPEAALAKDGRVEAHSRAGMD